MEHCNLDRELLTKEFNHYTSDITSYNEIIKSLFVLHYDFVSNTCKISRLNKTNMSLYCHYIIENVKKLKDMIESIETA